MSIEYYDYDRVTEDRLQTFASPFEVGEHLRKRLHRFHFDVTFSNIHAQREEILDRDNKYGWDRVWIVTIDGVGVAGWASGWFNNE